MEKSQLTKAMDKLEKQGVPNAKPAKVRAPRAPKPPKDVWDHIRKNM